MKLANLALFIFLLSSGIARSQQLTWAKQFGQDKLQIIVSVAIDDDGNSYSLGRTEAVTTDINPGSGVHNITNPGAQTGGGNVFLVKLNTDGDFLWGKKLSDYYDSTGAIKVITAADGFIYVLMRSYPSPSTPGFIVKKFDSDGEEILSKELFDQDDTGDTDSMYAETFTMDEDSNIYIAGYFSNTITFDLANPEFALSYNGLGTFIIKLDADFDFSWVKALTENQAVGSKKDITLASDGHLLMFVQTAVMNEEESGYDHSTTLYKINAEDNSVIWNKEFEKQVFTAFESSPAGGIVIAAVFGNDVVDIDPSEAENLLTPDEMYNNVYLLWLSGEGEYMGHVVYYLEWNNFNLTNIFVDNEANYYFTGNFQYEYDVDPGPDEFILTASQSESLVLKFDNGNSFVSAFDLGDGQAFYINDGAILNDHIYFGGHFTSADFSPGEGEYWLDTTYNGVTGSDGYIMKWNPSLPPLGTEDFKIDKEVFAYPNPVKDYLTVELHSDSADSYVKLFDTFGRILFTTYIEESARLDMESFPSGIYFLEVGEGNGYRQKIVKY